MISFRLILLVIIIGVAAILPQLKLRPFPHVLLLFFLLIPIISLLYSLFLKRKIKVTSFNHTPALDRLQKARWTLQLTNHSNTQSAEIIVVKEDKTQLAYTLKPKETQQVLVEAKGQHVGPLAFPKVTLSLADSMRLFTLKINYQKPEDALVLPLSQESLYQEVIGRQLINQAQLLSTIMPHDELEEVRSMIEGDPMKRIHWKLSARLNEWFVRTSQMGPEHDLTLTVIPKNRPTDLDARDLFLETTTYYLHQILNVVPHKELLEYRKEMASIPYDYDFKLPQTDQLILFVEELTQTLLMRCVELNANVVIYLFNKSPYPNLYDLASAHNILIIEREIDES